MRGTERRAWVALFNGRPRWDVHRDGNAGKDRLQCRGFTRIHSTTSNRRAVQRFTMVYRQTAVQHEPENEASDILFEHRLGGMPTRSHAVQAVRMLGKERTRFNQALMMVHVAAVFFPYRLVEGSPLARMQTRGVRANAFPWDGGLLGRRRESPGGQSGRSNSDSGASWLDCRSHGTPKPCGRR